MKQHPKYYHHDLLRHGICIPQVCPNIPQEYYFVGHGQPNGIFEKLLSDCYSDQFQKHQLIGEVTYIFCDDGRSRSIDSYDVAGG